MTAWAAAELTERFSFNIPQRWSIAPPVSAMLNGEEHVKDIVYLTTLAGYVHYKLTGEKVLGVGEASGMFPIDSDACDYDQSMIDSFDALAAEKGYPWRMLGHLPPGAARRRGRRRPHRGGGQTAGSHRSPGAGLPPGPSRGGRGGTGMAATNAVAPRTGNVSAGTSVFAMIVLEKALSKVYPEIDMVTTPTGKPVAMVHCNNCTNEINAWARVFRGFLEALGQKPDMNALFTAMFTSAAEGAADGGGLLLYNYLSGEPITDMEEGRLLLARSPKAELSFPNLMRAQLLSALATLKIGLDILAGEQVAVDRLLATAASSRRRRWARASWPPRLGPRCPSWRPPARAALGYGPAGRLPGGPDRRGVPGGLSGKEGIRRCQGEHPDTGAGGRGRLRDIHGPLPQRPCHRAGGGGPSGVDARSLRHTSTDL